MKKVLHAVEPFSSGIITFIITLIEGMPDYEHYVLHGVRVSEDKIEKVRSRFSLETKFIIWESAQRSVSIISDFKALFEFYKTYKKISPDVIHLHSSKAGFIGRLAGMFIKCKIIYTPNGAAFNRTDVNLISKYSFRFLEWLANLLSGEVICCSKSEMESFKSIGIKSKYVNNGIKIIPINKPRTKNKLVIGCMALITEQKNPSEFNEIAKHFIDNSGVEFLWIGDGHLRKSLDSDNIIITGWMDEIESQKHLASLDIYLSCSLWEGLPFSVLEAMRSSCCLVLRDCVGNRDLVQKGQNGYLYENFSKAIAFLEALLSEQKQVSQYGSVSRQMVETQFSSNQCVEAYKHEYQRH